MDHVDDAGLPNTARSSVDLAIVGVIAGHMELHLKVPRGRHDPGVPEPSVRRCAMGTSYVLPVHHIARQRVSRASPRHWKRLWWGAGSVLAGE